MPSSKLRKAIGAVKDQTSISLAKVSSATTSSSTIGVAVLKATTHEDAPVDHRYIEDILILLSSGSRTSTISCVEALSKRISRTRNWIVALKSLLLLLHLLRSGHPLLPGELLRSMKRGPNILNLSSFKEDCTSSYPSHFTSFVRSFALYLDERLSFLLAGKLTRLDHHHHPHESITKPVVLLDRISCWQHLLNRVISTRAKGESQTNRLVQNSMYEIAKDSFDIYGDISEGLASILDSFFSLPHQSCVVALHTCVKAERQFEELCSFYGMCRSMGIGRSCEYPTVQKISTELIDRLKEFVRDGVSSVGNGRCPPLRLLLRQRKRMSSDMGSDFGSRRTSLEDLFSVTDPGMSFSFPENQREKPDGWNCGEHRSFSVNELVALDSWPDESNNVMGKATSVDSLYSIDRCGEEEENVRRECWETMLVDSVTRSGGGGDCKSCLNLNDGGGIACNNPFADEEGVEGVCFSSAGGDNGFFSVAPTFQAVPMFWRGGDEVAVEGDPFAEVGLEGDGLGGGTRSEGSILNEQRLWVEQQKKIMANHFFCV